MVTAVILPAAFGLLSFAVVVGCEGIDDALDYEVVEFLLVAGEVCGMQSGGDDTETVIDAFPVAEIMASGGSACFYCLAPPAVIAQGVYVAEHCFPYSTGDSGLHHQRI